MWRALKSGGFWALFALTGLGAACGESPRAPLFPPLNTAGASNQGVAGSLSLAGRANTSTLSACAGAVPWAPLTRWPFVDLDATLDMLFGPGTTLASVAKIEDRGYTRDLSYVFVQALRQVAVDRAHSAVADSDVFESCGEDDDAPSCIAPWLRSWGEKLYRRPLTNEQTDAYVVQFRSALRDLSPAEAARNALVSMILSPYFVLRIELGDAKTGQLTSDELATRLSHFALRRDADSELRARAASGELNDPAARLTELHRLWDTPEGQNARALQHLAWLGLDADHLPSTFEPELRAAMLDQTKQLIDDVLRRQNGTLLELLSSPPPPLSPLLIEHYGSAQPPAEGSVTGSQLFAGMLSEPLFLSSYPRASQRGRALVQGLLCTPIPDHPAQADATLGVGSTPRERLNQSLSANPACMGCHHLIDPTGFALEAFDEQGRLTGFDSTGAVLVTDSDYQEPVANPNELGRAIASSEQGVMCAARHYLEYVLDRELPNPNGTGATGNAGPPPVPLLRENPEERWLECLQRSNSPEGFRLVDAAEQLVTSDAFSTVSALPKRVVAFDTNVAPLEHARQETSQFRGVFPYPGDQATIDRYLAALTQLQELDATATPAAGGEAGANGQAGAGSEGGAGGAP